MGNLGAKKNKGILIFLYSLFFAGAKKNLKNLTTHPPASKSKPSNIGLNITFFNKAKF